jgi:hypothetical protein
MNVPPRLEQRGLCILSVEDLIPNNYCLVNSQMKTVSSSIGARKQSSRQIMNALRDAFENLKSDLAAINLNALRDDVDF